MPKIVRRTVTTTLLLVGLLVLSSAEAHAQGVSDQAAELYQYHRGQDVFFMTMMVAFLMLFIKRYEWAVCLSTLLVLAVSWPLYLIIHVKVLDRPLDVEASILAVFASITLVIAIGVFLGHVSAHAMLIAAALFTPAYMFNEWFMFSYLDGVLDAGGSILVHVFAAYWGWGVILALRNRPVRDAPMRTTVHSVSFVWLGSMILFVLWPSFVTALLPPEQVVTGMINCYLALTAAVLTTYAVQFLFKRTIDALVYTYAILAGGVSIGATVNVVGPVTAWVIGAIAGIISALSFLYLNDWLGRKTGVLDTMGVHNLHGTPGIFGGLAALVVAGAPAAQGIAVIAAIVIALVTGLITGGILRLLPQPEPVLDDAEVFPMDEPRSTQVMEAAPKPSGTPGDVAE